MPVKLVEQARSLFDGAWELLRDVAQNTLPGPIQREFFPFPDERHRSHFVNEGLFESLRWLAGLERPRRVVAPSVFASSGYTSQRDRDSMLADLYDRTTQMFKGSTQHRRDLKDLSTRDHPVKGAATVILAHEITLARLYHEDDPIQFARRVDAYREMIVGKLAKAGPLDLETWVRDVVEGPNGYILHIAKMRFAGVSMDSRQAKELERALQWMNDAPWLKEYVLSGERLREKAEGLRDRAVRFRDSARGVGAGRTARFRATRRPVVAARARRGVRTLAR